MQGGFNNNRKLMHKYKTSELDWKAVMPSGQETDSFSRFQSHKACMVLLEQYM